MKVIIYYEQQIIIIISVSKQSRNCLSISRKTWSIILNNLIVVGVGESLQKVNNEIF